MGSYCPYPTASTGHRASRLLMAVEPLVRLRGITKSYSVGDAEICALTDVDLDVFPGEFLAIVGPSGAGKSTLMNILGLLDVPTSGQYLLAGQVVSDRREQERDSLRGKFIGFVFQSSHVMPYDSVARNAALALRTQFLDHRSQESIVGDALQQLGILGRAGALARTLSGGERQRLAIARAISTSPALLLADEPTGNLDSESGRKVVGLFRELNKQGVTVVLITHDDRVAVQADRQVRVIDGRVVDDSRRSIERESNPRDAAIPRAAPALRMRFNSLLTFAMTEAINSVLARKLQSLLILAAFALGVGGLITSVGLSSSASLQVANRISAAALNKVTAEVSSDMTTPEVESALRRLNRLDGVEAVGRQLQIPSTSISVSTLPSWLDAGSGGFAGRLTGADSSVTSVEHLRLEPASASAFLDSSSPVAFVGTGAARSLGLTHVGPGVQIWIGGRGVDVLGYIQNGGDLANAKDTVLLPVAFATTIGQGTPSFVLRTAQGYPAVVSPAVPSTILPGKPSDVSVDTVADLRGLASGVNSDFSIYIGLLSLAILILASFGAGVTMYLNVTNRRSEIALRRAVGAGRSYIRLLFLAEGAFLGLAGGGVGMAVGATLIVFVCLILGWAPALSIVVIFAGLVLGCLTGLAAAVIPAAQAARIAPADAIR